MRALRSPLIAVLAACAVALGLPKPRQEARAQGRPFTVAAAADLQFAFTEIGQAFERKTGRKVVFSFGATGNLARQIENGAPFDAFFAANEAFVARLEEKGALQPGTRRVYAIGHIVLATSPRAGTELKDLRGLLDPRVRRVAIANPDHAPYGMAAREALQKTGVWEGLQPKLVLGENVRQTLQFIQTGNADAGIVALSVAKMSDVRYQVLDGRLHSPLRQAAAVVKGSPNEATARQFLAYVLGRDGQSVMRRFGFQSPPRR